jgi:hypothetical protein
MTRTLPAIWLLVWLTLCACSAAPVITARDAADASDTGGAVDARNGTERDVLARLPQLPTGAAQLVGELSVTAEAPYAAASGRTCRPVELNAIVNHQTRHRLACTSGGAWFFVPDVFAARTAAE